MPKRRAGLEVVNWRQLELEQCGFPRSLAARVARDDRYDLHHLIELVQQGCSPALAVLNFVASIFARGDAKD